MNWALGRPFLKVTCGINHSISFGLGHHEPEWLLVEIPEGDVTMKERNPAEVIRLVKDEGIEVVDLRFCDLPGLMQHFSMPAHTLTEEMFTEGNGFDGSSIRGFQQIH